MEFERMPDPELSEPKGHQQGSIELGQLHRPQHASPTGQHPLGEGEHVVTVGGTRPIETFGYTHLHLSHVTAKRTRHENTDDRRQKRERRVTGHDHDGMAPYPWNVRLPDLTSGDQRSLSARHEATENAASLSRSSSWAGSVSA